MLQGIATAWALNNDKSESYLLGHKKMGGWWYFFLVAIAVKSPISLLVLATIGFTLTIFVPDLLGRWSALTPSAALAAVLSVTMHVGYQRGLGHILVALLLLVIIAGLGIGRIFELRRPTRLVLCSVVAALLLWQAAESPRAQSDFIAYFNEFVGSSPSHVLITGCDLDCGQDLLRLVDEVRAGHIRDVNLAVFTSADLDRSGLPHHEIPDAATRPHGWIAVSSGLRDWAQDSGSRFRPTTSLGWNPTNRWRISEKPFGYITSLASVDSPMGKSSHRRGGAGTP